MFILWMYGDCLLYSKLLFDYGGGLMVIGVLNEIWFYGKEVE